MSADVNPEAASPSPARNAVIKVAGPKTLTNNMSARDREFLPAALEILETPPSPTAIAMLLAICGFVALALAWSFIGRLDVQAVAQGKIETAARTKVIQPLDPGKVKTINVENGQRVKAGELLIEFDPTETQADERDYSDQLSAALAELVRRRTAVEVANGAKEGAALTAPEIAWEASTPKSARLREQAVLQADVGQLADALADLDKQIAEKQATIERLNSSIAYQNKLIETLTDRVNLRNTGINLNVDTKVNLFDAKESLQKSQSSLASDQGQLIETTAAIKELGSQKQKAISQFIADNQSKGADAERKALDVAQQLAKAQAKLERTRLYAPIDGTVQQLAVTTVGQVVTTGQQLMVIVPSDSPLQVEVYMNNADIGFIKPGQQAIVKVDAFPFTRYGVLHGRVTRVATDAIDEENARRAEANATNLTNSANVQPSTNGQPNFVFPVTIALDEDTIRVGDSNFRLSPGMTVTGEVNTDNRRVIDYFFSPLAKVASEALRER
jgi:hemolysin D